MFRVSGPRRGVWLAVVGVVVVAVGVVGSLPALAGPRVPVVVGAGAASAVEGSYLVRLKDTADVRKAGVGGRARALAGEYGGSVVAVFTRTMRGFSVRMAGADALRLSVDADVESVRQDQYRSAARGTAKPAPAKTNAGAGRGAGGGPAPSAVQSPVSWGLDRIDQHALPLDNNYAYDDSAGDGVRVYVISGGIQVSHPDFGGRAVGGPNFVPDGGRSDVDCDDGGPTGLAGVVGGTQHGVAKRARMVAVRVFGCRSPATSTSIQQGFEWVIGNAVRPAVILFELADKCFTAGGEEVDCDPETAQSYIDAQEAAFGSGVAVVTNAGDSAMDACGRSSGAAPDSLHVGATTSSDARAGFSNFGSCVTMYAPGENVVTDAPSGSTTASGTNLAAAYVAGTVALFMSKPEFAGASPGRVRDELISGRSTPDVVTGLPGGSRNRLLYTGPPGLFTVGSSVSLAPVGGDRLQLFGTNKATQLLSRQQNGAGSTSWSGWSTSVTAGWQSVGAGANADGRMALAGVTVAGGEVWVRQETTVGSNPTSWSTWAGLGAAPGNVAVGRVVMAHNHSNRLQVFASTVQGKVYYRSQLAVGSQTFSGWTLLPFTGKLRSLAAVANADGRIEVLGVDDAGAVWRAAQTSATDTNWGQFTKLPGFGVTTISAARNSNGALELVGVDAGGNTWRRSQTAVGGTAWGGWTPLPVKTFGQVSARTANNRVQVVGVDTLGRIWQSTQNGVNATSYAPWTQIDGALRP